MITAKVVLLLAAATAGLVLYLLLIVWMLARALADTGPPTPAPVISTGGNMSGSQQGSSCVTRTPPVFAPTDVGTAGWAWAEPDYPGPPIITRPTAPGVGCSR